MKEKQWSVGEGELFAFHSVLHDQRRHDWKVRQAVREHLPDLVAHEDIQIATSRHAVNVPLPQLKEFRITWDFHQYETVGQTGESQNVNRPRMEGPPRERPSGVQGGDGLGWDVTDAMVTLEDAADIVFEQWALPDVDLAKPSPGIGEEVRVENWGRHGLQSQWARRPTMRESLRRRALSGLPGSPAGLAGGDARYWQHDFLEAEYGGAVVLAMMDTSGSMGAFEKYLAKSFFFWMVEFLRRNYPRVDIVFLAHDVRAREVDEETFFHRGSSGGTVSSSVYRMALDILEQRYPSVRYNRYAFHFSDGGNLTSDNVSAVNLGRNLAKENILFGYGEIHDTDRNPSPLYQAFQENGVGVVLLRTKQDIVRALDQYFIPKGTLNADHSKA